MNLNEYRSWSIMVKYFSVRVPEHYFVYSRNLNRNHCRPAEWTFYETWRDGVRPPFSLPLLKDLSNRPEVRITHEWEE